MNIKMMIFTLFAFACVNARTLNVLPSFSGDVLEQFQSLSSGPFYGFDAVGGTTQSSSTTSDNGFATGGFSTILAADNNENGSGTVSGGALLTSIADATSSEVRLVSESTADANGPGVANVLGGGFGSAQFGNSNAAFGVSVAGENNSGNAKTDANIVGGALTRDGYSASATQFCVGSNCP